MGMFQPILYLLLFGPLLEGATSTAGATGSAFNWFVPGLLIMTGFFAAAFAGFGLVAELRYGVVERMRVTPMSRFAMLAGRSLRDVTILMGQAILLIVVAIPFGPRARSRRRGPDARHRRARRPDVRAAVLHARARLQERGRPRADRPVPRPTAAPAVRDLPPDDARARTGCRRCRRLNPLTHAVDAARALFNGMWDDPQIVVGATIMGTLTAVALFVASRAFSRATA